MGLLSAIGIGLDVLGGLIGLAAPETSGRPYQCGVTVDLDLVQGWSYRGWYFVEFRDDYTARIRRAYAARLVRQAHRAKELAETDPYGHRYAMSHPDRRAPAFGVRIGDSTDDAVRKILAAYARHVLGLGNQGWNRTVFFNPAPFECPLTRYVAWPAPLTLGQAGARGEAWTYNGRTWELLLPSVAHQWRIV